MKYRIWNKLDKKFYNYNKLDKIKWLIDMDGNLSYIDLNDFSWGGLIPKDYYDINEFVIKDNSTDINAKEIYEGDYVTKAPLNSITYEVIRDKDRWMLKDISYTVGKLEYLYDNNGKQHEFTVIGNKYEYVFVK